MSTDTIVLNLTDSPLWAPYKSLLHVVNNAIVCKDVDAIPDLEISLKNHKPDFICLLKNPARNQLHREAVKKAAITGIAVVGQPGLQVLQQQLIDEALIISDMFDLNELTALELLIAGQHQQPHFPGLTRGLVAMLLYYDGRRSLVSALRTLVQAREGKSWTLGLSSELTTLVTNFTNQLKEEGMIMKVIDLIESMDISRELELLHKNRALGGPRYRKQVTDLITEIKHLLAEVILCWACQSTLSHEETMRLLNHIAKKTGVTNNDCLDEPTLTLTMAFLYVIDVGYLQTCNEMDPGIRKLNLVCCPDLAASIHKELFTSERGNSWHLPELKPVFQFAWGLVMRVMFQFPLASLGISFGENVEDDESLIETAIEAGAFNSLKKLIIQSPLFKQEEFFMKRIHTLITDFIILMPIKVKDMRNIGDEAAKIIAAHAKEGLEPPANLPMHFQHFLYLITEMYAENPLGLDLSLDYWCSVDNLAEPSFSQRPTQRQVALFKFVRLAGDLLPAPLFVPYHKMLTSLSSSRLGAHQCFNLLKINGRNVVGSNYNLVSWDHFFSTLHSYYNNLREELAVAPDAGYTYRQKMLTKGITPQEVQGLTAVLDLISQVVRMDEIARVTLADNPQYSPCLVLLGLISCSVSPDLKASLIQCLAAFAESSAIAFKIWQGLEATQVIPTIPTTSVYHPSGILTEIEEIETRNEKYPVTLAILKLFDTLLDHPFPVSLGSGRRQPGLQPYMDFVRDKVLLLCNSRVYKSLVEKWKVITLCLKIIEKVLRSYEIRPQTPVSSSHLDSTIPSSTIVNGHPGFSIISEMLQDSGLLRMVLYILDDGMRILDMYSPFEAQLELEKGTLLALSLLHETLLRQEAFLQKIRDSSCDLLVTSLDNLLMSINPRSGQVDHLLVISKYVTYNTMIPHHSLLSIRVLLLLCSSSQIVQHLVAVYEVDPKESDMLLHGFVECLEVDVAGEDEDSVITETTVEISMVQARNKARQQLLLFILNCLKFPSPNVSHYLLGFNLRRPVSQTEIQEPGVMGSRRTCLHAVLSLLDAGTNTSTGPFNVHRSPYANSLAYQLIYALCANKDTSGPILRYLRSTHDFFYRHLQFLPFKCREKYDAKILSQQSWLLRAVAIELRVTSAHHQSSHVQRLLLSFLDDKAPLSSGPVEGVSEFIPGLSNTSAFSFIKHNAGPLRRKLMRILDSLDFTQPVFSVPQWEYFDSDELQRVFKECKVVDPNGLPSLDISGLHKKLTDEISALQNISGFSQRSMLIQQEITSIIKYALEYNKSREMIFAKKQSFDAWRQVTEILLIACPLDILGSEKKHQMVLEIAQELIRRIMCDDFLPELMPLASGVILTLTATLRHSGGTSRALSSYMPYLLPDSADTLPSNLVSGLTQPAVPVIHHSSLLVVLKAIVECLLKTGSGFQRVRASFYTALLNLLCIVQKPYDVGGSNSTIEAAVLDQESENRKLRTEYMNIILSFGEMIMEVICRDACTGHDITKMLALAVLDVAISLDSQQIWLSFLVNKGYLRHILDSLMKDDEQLQNLLSRSSSSFRIFYVFESKMALLTRISSTPSGALAMLRNGAIGKLSECRVLDSRPNLYLPPEMRRENESWILPDLMKCYRQILKAMMKLVLSIMMSFGSQHREVTLQLLSNISCNSEFFLNVLRDRTVLSSVAGLEELSLVTAVLSRASLDDPDSIAADTVLLENRGQLLLLRQQLLSLLPCLLAFEDSTSQWGRPVGAPVETDVSSQAKLLRLQIAAHILGLCCAAVTRSGFDVSSCHVLFGPSLAEATSSVATYELGNQSLALHRTQAGRNPDLGLVVTLLYQCSTQLLKSIDDHNLLLLRLQSLSTLTSDELSQYLPVEVKVEHITAQRQREIARDCLLELLQYHVKEVMVLSYMIESSAFILLRHLEYFFHISKKNELPFMQSPKGDISMHHPHYLSTQSGIDTLRKRPYEASLSQQEFENFKSELSTVLSESFFKKLQSVIQHINKGRSHVSFLEAMVHRIKRFVRLQAR